METQNTAVEITIKNFKIPDKPDDAYIRHMFDRLAGRYDIFTKLIGFGQDQRLRRHALKPLKKGMRVLDLACGTGDLSLMAAQMLEDQGDVVGIDFSSNMIKLAKERSLKHGLTGRIRWIEGKAEDLPLGEERFDLIVSGYALRNFYENIREILGGVYASLSEKGCISFLDLTEPPDPVRRAFYHFYMNVIVGFYGALLFGKNYPIPYLPKSASRFFKAHEFTEELKKAGFREVTKKSYMLGAVTLYQASK